MRWLWTGEAIKTHAVFLVAIALLATKLLQGNQRPEDDYLLGLVFCVIAYPTVLLLVWLRCRADGEI